MIEMKTKSVFYIYGEPTVTISFKVPESKKDKIMDDIRDNVLSKYENPMRVDIDIKVKERSRPKQMVSSSLTEKKSNPADDVIEKGVSPINEKPTAKISFKKIDVLPFGTESIQSFGSKGALRCFGDVYYTKRSFLGKLEVLEHNNYESAVLYANENFK